jgi:ABC-type amino acid transport substrate-binding protein
MRFSKTSLVFICVLVLNLGFVASGLAQEVSLLDEIQKRGVLRVGVMLDFPPLGFRNDKGEPVGFNVTLAEDMAKALGVKLEIVETVAANRIPALVSKRIDVSSAALTITSERAKVVAFTIPDRRAAMLMLTHKDSPIKTLDDCKNFRIGSTRGSTDEINFLEYFKKKGAKINYISYDASADSLLALNQNKVDAITGNDVWFGSIMAKQPGKFKIIEPSYFNEWTGLAVRYGDPKWLNCVNTCLWLEHIYGRIKQLHDDLGLVYIAVSPAYE